MGNSLNFSIKGGVLTRLDSETEIRPGTVLRFSFGDSWGAGATLFALFRGAADGTYYGQALVGNMCTVPVCMVERTEFFVSVSTGMEETNTVQIRNSAAGGPVSAEELREMMQKLNEAGSAADAVRYSAQELTDEQKAQARTNIGAAAKGEGGGGGSLPEDFDPAGFVSTKPQELNADQKAQARENIGAAPKEHADTEGKYGKADRKTYGHVMLTDNINKDETSGVAATPEGVANAVEKAVETVVRNEAQKLSDSQKTQARENIGAAPESHAYPDDRYGAANFSRYGHVRLLNNANSSYDDTSGYAVTPYALWKETNSRVSVNEQTLTDEQKAQVRANIGAAAVGEGGGWVQPDLEADEGVDGHVKNRTHWVDWEYTEAVAEKTLSYPMNGNGLFDYNPSAYGPVDVGSWVVVTWDGAAYRCKAYLYKEKACIGNAGAFYSDAENTGEPFFMYKSAVGTMVIAAVGKAEGQTATHTYKLEMAEPTYHKLDNSYLDLSWIPKLENRSIAYSGKLIADEMDGELLKFTMPEDFELENGVSYTVQFGSYLVNSVKCFYEQVGVQQRYYLGNAHLIDSQYTDTGEPFCFCEIESGTTPVRIILAEKPYGYELGVTEMRLNIIREGKVPQMPPVYLPDVAVRATGQRLTEEQKAQVRANIGAAAVGEGGGATVEPADDDIPKVFFGAALPQTKDDAVMSFRYISKTKDISGYCKTKAQGNSSMSYPKKNQTVKLYKDAECSEKLKVDFKGWGEQNKFCFKANWVDLTHARNIVSARLWGDVVKSRANYASIPELLRTSPNQGAVDGFPVKVYANGIYQGRYTLNIPKDAWMANMDDEQDNHCILCGESNASDRSLFRAEANIDESDWSDEVHDTVPDAIKTKWNAAIRFVMNSTDENFKAGIGGYFDVASLIDYYLFGIVSCGLDAFGKNQLYMTYNGQKWYATMYDLDSTWGLWWNGTSFVPYTYSRNEYQDFKDGNGNLLYIRLEALFVDEIKARWTELRNGALTVDNIINRFERFTDTAPLDLVKEDYASTTANGEFAGIPSATTNNIQQIRAYIVSRLSWCDAFINELAEENTNSVPSAYTAIAYAESDGLAWFDTEVSGGTNAEYEIVFDATLTDAHGYEQYFSGDKDSIIPKLYLGGGNTVICGNTSTENKNIFAESHSDNTPYVSTVRYNKNGEVVLDGVVKDSFNTAGNGWGNLSWYVFNSHGEPNLSSSMRLYGLKMWTDGELVRNFVPVYRNSDETVGLYDTVSGRFFESIGSEAFKGFTGTASEYRPSVEIPDGYNEVVLDGSNIVVNVITTWTGNEAGKYGMTHFEYVLPFNTTADSCIAPSQLIPMPTNMSNVMGDARFRGMANIWAIIQYNGNSILTVSMPESMIGDTADKVNAWLAEHNIVFYVKA